MFASACGDGANKRMTLFYYLFIYKNDKRGLCGLGDVVDGGCGQADHQKNL
jgi:hypothetical protein